MIRSLRVVVNGSLVQADVEPRRTLADFLREDLHLHATHLGCEHGVCGACTVWLDGEPIRSCLLLAVQADGAELTTVEGLAEDEDMHLLQQVFHEHHALQCGFCTPGFLLTALHCLRDQITFDDEQAVRAALSGNLCRCTGYQNIVAAVIDAGARLRSRDGTG